MTLWERIPRKDTKHLLMSVDQRPSLSDFQINIKYDDFPFTYVLLLLNHCNLGTMCLKIYISYMVPSILMLTRLN